MPRSASFVRRPSTCTFRHVACLLLSLLLAISACSPAPAVFGGAPLLLPVSAAPSTARGAASINTLYLELFRESLTAYQLQADLPWITLSVQSGSVAGIAAATSGLYDWVVTTSSVSEAMRAAHPNLEAYPLITVPITPAYNLPTATVGSATLSLHSEVMCRIWRGNITHWSVAAKEQKGMCLFNAFSHGGRSLCSTNLDFFQLSSLLLFQERHRHRGDQLRADAAR